MFDSSIILISKGGILMSIGDFPESLSQAMLAGCNVSRETGRNEMLAEYGLKAHRGVGSNKFISGLNLLVYQMCETQRRTVSSNSRSPTIRFQQYSANLSL